MGSESLLLNMDFLAVNFPCLRGHGFSCLNSHTIPNWWTKTIKLIKKGTIMQEISINYAWR